MLDARLFPCNVDASRSAAFKLADDAGTIEFNTIKGLVANL